MFELSVQAEGQDNYRMQNVNYEFWENILWRLSLCTGPVELVSKSRNKVHQTWLKPFSRALYWSNKWVESCSGEEVRAHDATSDMAAAAAHNVRERAQTPIRGCVDSRWPTGKFTGGNRNLTGLQLRH